MINTKISITKIIAAIVGGIIGFILSEIVYTLLKDVLWKPLVVALFFLILAGAIFLSIFIVSVIIGDFAFYKSTKANHLTFKRAVPLAFAVIFLLSMLLEFIYEISIDFTVPQPTSYIFALDVSGSMNNTDPNHDEANAVKKIIENTDDKFPFAIYTFSSSVNCLREMHEKDQADLENEWTFDYEGGTRIYGVLNQIIEDYKAKKNSSDWVGGDSPRVILVSDGQPTDGGGFFNASLGSILDSYKNNNVSICTIGVKSFEKELMERLAQSTGGKCFKIDNIDEIYDTLNSALTATASDNRTLISVRPFTANEILYKIMRICFLLLIVCAFFAPIYFANSVIKDLKLIIITKIITGILAGIMAEVFFQNGFVNELSVRCLICILAALSILRTVCRERNTKENYHTVANNSDFGAESKRIDDDKKSQTKKKLN